MTDDGYYDELSRLNNELVNLQRELAKKNAELEKLDQLKSRFLGMAAHDLRQPLGAITAFGKLLVAEASELLTEEQRHFLSRIVAAGEYMARVVDDFLDVAVIESGHLNLELTDSDLVEVIERVVELLRAQASPKGVQLEFEHPSERMWARLDANKIEQALINLVSNAIEHSHNGQRVTVQASTGGERVLVEVRDRGVGMSAEDLARLFDPLHKKSAFKTAGEKSTGLGLVIARTIVEAHGGTITATSEAGSGATFCVALPIGANQP